MTSVKTATMGAASTLLATAVLVGTATPAPAATTQIGDGVVLAKGAAVQVPLFITCEHDSTTDLEVVTVAVAYEVTQRVTGKTTTRGGGSLSLTCNGDQPIPVTVTASPDSGQAFKKGVAVARVTTFEFVRFETFTREDVREISLR
jgi:hypothetical protein